MTRFIVIERGTGGVYGDTARYGPMEKAASPADAVCLIDRHVGRAARGFGYAPAGSMVAEYDVYEVLHPEPFRVTASDDEAHALAQE